nr:MAG TPA: hypothetical protein [Caudoviricetes sp.]
MYTFRFSFLSTAQSLPGSCGWLFYYLITEFRFSFYDFYISFFPFWLSLNLD